MHRFAGPVPLTLVLLLFFCATTDRMAKTKYDWSGVEDAKKFESTKTDSFLESFKTPVSKKVAAKKAPAKKKSFF